MQNNRLGPNYLPYEVTAYYEIPVTYVHVSMTQQDKQLADERCAGDKEEWLVVWLLLQSHFRLCTEVPLLKVSGKGAHKCKCKCKWYT